LKAQVRQFTDSTTLSIKLLCKTQHIIWAPGGKKHNDFLPLSCFLLFLLHHLGFRYNKLAYFMASKLYK